MSQYRIKVASDQDSLAELTSNHIVEIISMTLSTRERCQIALSGGSTPHRTYSLLRHFSLPWNRVDIFLGDERWVDPMNDSSNALMLRNTLLYEGESTKASFFPTPTLECQTPQDSARAFSSLIQNTCEGLPPVFDLILLGLGDDGHTASLFPYSDSLKEIKLFATVGNAKGHDRVTLTHPVLSSAKNVAFLVSGTAKQTALKRLIDPNENPMRTPAKLVNPSSPIVIFTDDEAAALI